MCKRREILTDHTTMVISLLLQVVGAVLDAGLSVQVKCAKVTGYVSSINAIYARAGRFAQWQIPFPTAQGTVV